MDRREFLAKAGLVATWAAISVKVSGCGEDGNPAEPEDGDVNADVSFDSGHTHSVTITAAQIEAASGVTLQLSSASGHVHEVALSSAEVMDIGAGEPVTTFTLSDSTGHSHSVTFN
jgi:hypothetical protein